MKTIVPRRDAGPATRRFALGLGIALATAALVPSVAAAGLWDGKWKIHVEGGAPGKMCLDQRGDFVEGKFQSEDPGKFGIISGPLSLRRQNWDGEFKDRGTGDKGKFHAVQGEHNRFDGWFKSKQKDGSFLKFDWSGVRVNADIDYDKCVKKIKQ